MHDLEAKIKKHSGEFLCEEIGNANNSKRVEFAHIVEPPSKTAAKTQIEALNDFYAHFGSVTLFHDKESDESAFYIAPPEEWDLLNGHFSLWIEWLDQEEEEELLPAWIKSRIVIGEIPATGNYLLVPETGADAGKVFEFEHDGFEFIELAPNVIEFVERALRPNASELRSMASHMRFITGDPHVQWWIRELRDADGRVVRND